jgi:glycosyltransferase involved in cell wall biosynthesis
VGRLAPQKGHRHLIEAMPALRERHPAAHLLIAGAGPLEGRLRSLIERLGLAGSVTLTGVRRDVPALLAAADGFVLPSLWEGAAGALVEAMALGVPAAVTADPGLREIAAGDAEYFPPADPRAIAAGLERLTTGAEAAQERAALAMPRVRALHDITVNTRALERVYEVAIGAAGSSG